MLGLVYCRDRNLDGQAKGEDNHPAMNRPEFISCLAASFALLSACKDFYPWLALPSWYYISVDHCAPALPGRFCFRALFVARFTRKGAGNANSSPSRRFIGMILPIGVVYRFSLAGNPKYKF
jgi:hypothetical protein